MSHTVIAGIGAAPILPAISTLGAFLAFCLAVALTVLWVQILRGPLVRLAGVHFLRLHPFGWLNTVVHNVDAWLDATVKGTERAVTWSFHSLMWTLSTTAQLTADLAEATWRSLEIRKRHEVRQVGAQTGQSISPRLKTLEKEYKGIDHRLDRVERREQAKRGAGAAAGAQDTTLLRRGIDRLNKRVGHLAHELDAVEHANAHAGAKARTGAQAIPRTEPRNIAKARKATRNWHEVLTRLGAASLVVAALAPLGLNFLRCPSLLRMGKRLGCSGFGWLEAFFATTFEALVVLDLCRFALGAQRLARLIVPQLAGVLLVQNAVCLGGGASYPSAHDSPKTLTRVTLPSAHD